jgi:hypothetical protein
MDEVKSIDELKRAKKAAESMILQQLQMLEESFKISVNAVGINCISTIGKRSETKSVRIEIEI